MVRRAALSRSLLTFRRAANDKLGQASSSPPGGCRRERRSITIGPKVMARFEHKGSHHLIPRLESGGHEWEAG